MDNSRLSLDRKVLTRPTELLLPPRLPINEWQHVGEKIFHIMDASGWWLGDWLVFGQNRYPERYRHVIEETSLDYQTLRNYAWIARKFAPERRRETLSMQHHAEVAALSVQEQDRWLDLAERFRWSRATLRKKLRSARSGENGEGLPDDAVLKVEPSPEQKERWMEAAKRSNHSLSEWMLSVLDREALMTLDRKMSAVV